MRLYQRRNDIQQLIPKSYCGNIILPILVVKLYLKGCILIGHFPKGCYVSQPIRMGLNTAVPKAWPEFGLLGSGVDILDNAALTMLIVHGTRAIYTTTRSCLWQEIECLAKWVGIIPRHPKVGITNLVPV